MIPTNKMKKLALVLNILLLILYERFAYYNTRYMKDQGNAQFGIAFQVHKKHIELKIMLLVHLVKSIQNKFA